MSGEEGKVATYTEFKGVLTARVTHWSNAWSKLVVNP